MHWYTRDTRNTRCNGTHGTARFYWYYRTYWTTRVSLEHGVLVVMWDVGEVGPTGQIGPTGMVGPQGHGLIRTSNEIQIT